MTRECHLFFETLGTKVKLDILTSLREGPLSVNELSRAVNHERSKVSHALRSLHDCRFVVVSKDGRRRIYSLNTDTIVPLLDLVERHMNTYCKGKGCKNRARQAR